MKSTGDRLRQITRGLFEGKSAFARAFMIILWLVMIVFFVWIFIDNWGEIRGYLGTAEPVWLAGTAFGYLLSIVGATLGWSLIMRPLAPGISRRVHNRIYATTLVSRRLPGTLWYVGGRMVLYRRLGIPGSLAGLASAIEMGLIIITGLALGIAILPPQGASEVLGWIVIGLGVIALAFSPRIVRWFSARRGVELAAPIRWGLILGWIAAYIATWTSGGIMVFYIIRIFTPIAPGDFLFVLGSWAFSGALGSLTIFLPSTFGVAEISLSLLLSAIMPLPLAGIVAVATRLLTTAYDLLLAAAFFTRRQQLDLPEESA